MNSSLENKKPAPKKESSNAFKNAILGAFATVATVVPGFAKENKTMDKVNNVKIENLTRQIDSVETVKSNLEDSTQDLQMQFHHKVQRFNTIANRVLEKMNKEDREYYKDVLNLPAHLEELNKLSLSIIGVENPSPEIAKRIAQLQVLIKHETGLMAILSNPQMAPLFGTSSSDIAEHEEWGHLRPLMLKNLLQIRGTNVRIGHEEDLLAELLQNLSTQELTADTSE